MSTNPLKKRYAASDGADICSAPPFSACGEDAAPRARRTWRAGTLTYTMGGIAALFCWLLWGDFAWNIKDRSVNQLAQLMLKMFGASDMLNGIMVGSLPSALGLILSPIISYRSDRHRGRWGRRVPYLMLTTPIAALSMAAIGACPLLGRMLHEMLGAHSPGYQTSVLIFFGLFWTLFEIFNIAGGSVLHALINDVVPTALLGRFYGLFRAVSLLVGILFNYYLMGKIEAHYQWFFAGIGLLYGVGFLAMCLKVKEGEYPPPPEVESGRGGGFITGIKLYFKECYSNPYYLWIFGSYALLMVSLTPINTFSLFYAKSLNIGMEAYGKYLAVTYGVSLCLSYFLGALADRFHPLRVGIAGMSLYAALMLWGGLFISGESTFGVAFVAHGVLAGVFLTGTQSIGQRLFPKARFAQFSSAMWIVIATANMLIPPLAGRFLDYSGHVYRYTFLMGAAMAALGVMASVVAYRKFVALGGPVDYQAPE